MLFKTSFIATALSFAALTAAADVTNEARSVDAGTARMVKIKRAQDSILADQDLAKRAAHAGTDSAKLVRRAAKGAHRADKRHHGDVAHEKRKVEDKPVEKRDLEERDLALFPGLQSLLHKLYPGLNTAVLGTEATLTGAVSGLDDVLKKREMEERDLALFPGLQSLLHKLYPGLNTAVLGTEATLTGAVSGLDDVLKKREATEANDVEKRDLPLFLALQSLLNKAYPGLNTVVLGTEATLTGAVSGLDDVLKKREATAAPVNDVEKRDLPLFLALQSLLNKAYPGLNTAVLGTEATLTGAVSGLDDVLKKRATTIKANVKINLRNTINNLLGGGLFSALSSSQISQLTSVLNQASSAGQLNQLIGSGLSSSQFSQLTGIVSQGLLGSILGGLTTGGTSTGGLGSLLNTLTSGLTSAGSTAGTGGLDNLLGGLLGGLTTGNSGNLLSGLQGLSLKE